jgi:hypothetical protein
MIRRGVCVQVNSRIPLRVRASGSVAIAATIGFLLPPPNARADVELCGSVASDLENLNFAIAEFIGESDCTLIEIGEDFEIERIDHVLEPIAPIVIDPTGSSEAIAKSLTINGNMHVLIGIGLPSGFVVFLAKSESPFVLTVRNLGMSGFGGSGALSVISDATVIERSLFINNQFQTSPGLPNFDEPTAGAVNALGELTIQDSEFENNHGSNGGAVYSAARPVELDSTTGGSPQFIITGSTFTANVAGAVGGAISAGQSLYMTNSTLAGNTAVSAGGTNVVGSATINFCTIAGNTSTSNRAAVSAEGTVSITNSIVYSNPYDPTGLSGVFADVSADGTVTISSSLVTSSDSIASTLYTAALDESNIVGQDPLLSPLGHYGGFGLPGGAVIRTRPPQIGSPVIDKVDPAAVGMATDPTDQRGADFPRIINGRADMGAVEYWPAVVPGPPINAADPLPDFSELRWSPNGERQADLPDTK